MTHRHGDILQVFPALAAIKLALPDCELHYLAEEFCAPMLGLAPWVDRLHVLPERLGLAETGEKRLEAEARLETCLRALPAEKFDRVINLMPGPEAARLARLAAPDPSKARGRVQLRHGIGLHGPSHWVLAMEATPQAWGWQPFHYSELFQRMAAEGLDFGIEPKPVRLKDDRKAGEAFARGLNPEASLPRPWVGLQLGASKGARLMPQAWLATFAADFFKRCQGSLLLLGGEKDLARQQALLESLGPQERLRCVASAGKSSLPALANLCASLECLVSADTLALHLAAVLGTPCVGLYPAMANPVETGPYAAGHRILWVQREEGPCDCVQECLASTRCWDAIGADAALAEALDLLGIAPAAKFRPGVRRLESALDALGYCLHPLDGVPLRRPENQAHYEAARAATPLQIDTH